MKNTIKQRNILFAVGGFQPQIITQALYHFNIDLKSTIDEVVIVSTKTSIATYYEGYPVRNTPVFLGASGKLSEYYKEYNLPLPIIRVFKIADSLGNEVDQLRSQKDFDSAAYTIITKLRGLGLNENDSVYCIYAGGQRVLASYLMTSLVLIGDNRHHIYYIKVSENNIQESPNFFYPPIKPVFIKNLEGKEVNTANIRITANEINFPRLGIKYSGLIRTDTNYKEIIDHIQGFISAEQKPVKVSDLGEGTEPIIIGKSKKLQECLDKIKTLASQGFSPILLYGESGTGKELFADYYHYWFRKMQTSNSKFITINCAAIPKELIESELFGAGKGSYTGATEDRVGQLTSADGGVAFLDEINSAPMSMQAKLLRFIENGEVQILGNMPKELKKSVTNGQLKVDVKIVSALNESAESLIKKGEFRKDLYYRLGKVKITIPPLRERQEDIPDLVEYFLEKYCLRYGKANIQLSSSLLEKLTAYEWPGNIRELRDYIEKLVVLSTPDDKGVVDVYDDPSEDQSIINESDISPEQILQQIAGKEFKNKSLDELVTNFEHWLIHRAYSNNESNAAQTAKELGIPASTLKDKLKKYSIS